MFREARAKKSRQSKRKLHHIRIFANGREDGHLIEHHFDDGSTEQFEFPHDWDGNVNALAHLRREMGMESPNVGDEQEEA